MKGPPRRDPLMQRLSCGDPPMRRCHRAGTPPCRGPHARWGSDPTAPRWGAGPGAMGPAGLVGGLAGCRQQPSFGLLPPRSSFSCPPGQHKEGSVALKIPSATAGQDGHSQAIRHSRARTWHRARAEPGTATQHSQRDGQTHGTRSTLSTAELETPAAREPEGVPCPRCPPAQPGNPPRPAGCGRCGRVSGTCGSREGIRVLGAGWHPPTCLHGPHQP